MLALLLLGACSPDPTLRVEGEGKLLAVGQRASLRVTVGDQDESKLDLATFVLTDAAKRTYRAGAAGLDLAALTAWEVGFAVPAGVAPGPGSLSVGTKRGAVFSAALAFERVIAVRDSTGKIWLTALSGAEGAIATFGELTPTQAGAGAGRLAVGASGRVLAVAGAELRLVALERPARSSAPLVLPAATRDVALTAKHAALIANDQGLYLSEPPSSIDEKTAPKLAAAQLLDRPTLAIALDRTGARGAAVTVEGSPARYQVVLLNLLASPPAVIARVPLAWTVDAAATIDVALGPDAGAAVVVSSAQAAVAILRSGAASPTELPLPSGQAGPVSVTARAAGLFQVALKGSRSVLPLKLGPEARFEAPVELGLTNESGAPVAIAGSENDETVVLCERELVLILGNGKPRLLKPPSGLFANKTKSDPGASLALQP